MARTEIRFEVRLEGEADSFREAKRRAFISFDIIGREIGDYSNWLDVQISALFGNLHGISNATMESYDFRRLQAVLQKLLSGSSQKEEFSPLEPWITIEFCIKEDGSIWAEGDLNDELGPGYYLHFHFKMNRQQIESAIASCERVVLAYPVVREPSKGKKLDDAKNVKIRTSISGLAYAFAESFPARTHGKGETLVSAKDAMAASILAAKALINQRIPIRGHEARFLRREIGMRAEELAQALGLEAQVVEYWESKPEARLPAAYEVSMRSMAAEHFGITLHGTFGMLVGTASAPKELIIRIPPEDSPEARRALEQVEKQIAAIGKNTKHRRGRRK